MEELRVTVGLPIDAAEEATRAALSAEGFGVLSEIDVAATLRDKLGVERAPLRILGACNPGLAQRALEIDVAAALVLPCNVVLSGDRPDATTVTIADPRALMADAAFDSLTAEAASRLRAVVDRLRAAPPPSRRR